MSAQAYSSDVAFTPSVKAVQARKGSRRSYARIEERGGWQTCIEHVRPLQQSASVEHWAEERSKGLYATSRVSDDGMIDPRDTRTVLAIALSACHNKTVAGTKEFGTWRM